MQVIELRDRCRELNLPVSGSKEKLKRYLTTPDNYIRTHASDAIQEPTQRKRPREAPVKPQVLTWHAGALLLHSCLFSRDVL